MRNRDDTLRIVRGLLAKAADEACTEAEAASFLAAANKMMLKYCIDEAELNGPAPESGYGFLILWKGKRKPAFDNIYVNLLEKHFNVKPILQHLHGGQRQLVVFGKRDACQWASYVYEFLVAKFNHLWLTYRRYDPTVEENHRGSYYMGLHIGLDRKLQEAKDALSEETIRGKNALMVLQDNLDAAAREAFPNMKKRAAQGIDIRSEDAIAAGIVDGRSIEIMRPLPRAANAPRIGAN